LLGCGSGSANHAAKATATATYASIVRNSRRWRENTASGRQTDIAGFSAGAFVFFRVEDKG
jgi:hypothetical protein